VGNPEMRDHLRSLSFTEKIEILEKLRDRSLAFAAAGFRPGRSEESGETPAFCNCSDWEPCACGNQPPYHCMWCCRQLTDEQIIAAQKRGFYLEGKR
jgi:hypothetical protein